MDLPRQEAVVFSRGREIAAPSDEGQANVLRGEGSVGDGGFEGVKAYAEVCVLAFEGRVEFGVGHGSGIPCAGLRVILP